MSPPLICPQPDRLKLLLDATLPEDENTRLAEHVEGCQSCQTILDEITAADASWPALAPDLTKLDEAKTALHQAMAGLVTESATAGRLTQPAQVEEVSFDFLSPSDQPGSIGRLGNYEVLGPIGRGGMGVVLKALDPALNRIVAIKVLAPHLAVSPRARKRFIREAQAAAAINHDHVVTIHAVDEANGLPYLVMQYVSGLSLQERLQEADGPLDAREIIHIGRQVAAGLAAAHAQGLIHRDVKPANILLQEVGGRGRGSGVRGLGPDDKTHEYAGSSLTPDSSPLTPDSPSLLEIKITDFGLAKVMNEEGLSQTGFVAGTPHYMSPEQINGDAIDHRSDLYALGVLLYRMAAGREPFVGDDFRQVWSQHLFNRPASPSELSSKPLPPWLEHLILRLLQKDPAARPQSAEEVIRLLDQRPGGKPIPHNEEERLAALRRYRIMDTDPEQGFDDLAYLASHVCGTPIALITLVDADRQWFKSKVGLSMQETARNISFCTHTIMQTDPLVVGDATKDERFASSPLVCANTHVRFYAGIPLITPDGHALGAMCVMDRVPRQLSPDQVSALAALSRLVLLQLELRRDLLNLKDAVAEEETKK